VSDDLGRAEIDFVWGNFPPQPNNDRDGWYGPPGDGMYEYYSEGHATVEEWGDLDYYTQQGLKPSKWVGPGDSHKNITNQWQNFPNNEPNTSNAVDGIDDDRYVGMLNLFGLTKDEALQGLREMGVPEQYLRDFTFEGGYNDSDDPDYNGVVFYRYYDPEAILGYHWDGRPWLAIEAEGLVQYSYYYPGDSVRIDNVASDHIQRFGIVVIQTTTPSKDTWGWY
jgi:hypothetical protein